MTHRIAQLWDGFARRRTLAIVVMTLLPIVIRLALLPILPVPVPAVHDEFSYLFAAKTFLLGRMANPVPPMAVNFQTFHILSTPTYTSIFPIGQGLLLAAGKLFFGDYWFGVCLSVGVMCGTLVWMLYGWLPPRWALFGGLLAVLQFGIAHYWMNSYWGGALAAIGGNLLLGVVPRWKRHPRIAYGLLAGLGVGILAVTRTFEGLLLTIFVYASLLYWLARERKYSWDTVTLRALVPFSIVLLPILIIMALQFRAATGSPFLIPHELYRRQVATMPIFTWQKPYPAPVYQNDVMRKFFVDWEPGFEHAKDWGTLRGLIPGIRERARMWGVHYFPDRLYLPFAFLSLLAGFSRRIRLLGFYVLMAFVGSTLIKWLMPHYLAPVVGAMVAIHVQFLRYVRAWNRGAFIAMLVFIGALFTYRYIQRIPPDANYWANYREEMERDLEHRSGKHLVFVRYSEHHSLQDEWVYNEPDIPGAKVIWARIINPEQDHKLTCYFSDRDVWLVDADANPPRLEPLQGAAP